MKDLQADVSAAPEASATTSATERTTVLFVGGMPRSGSTLLDLMVGQLPGHCDVGELFYLWQAGVQRDQLCACGRAFAECPFWRAVGNEAFGGWVNVDAQRLLSLQRQVDTTSRLPLFLVRRVLPAHRARVQSYLDTLTCLYRAIAAVSGASVVVDSSKRPSTAFLLASAPGLDLRVVHVLRDPRGVVNSWSRRVSLPERTGARGYLKQRSLRQILRRWWSVNLMTEFLAHRGVPLVRLRYEDLVTEPVRAMHQVLALVEMEGTPEATAFLGPDGLRTGRSHAVAGGRVRMRTGPLPLSLDESWRRDLPRWKRVVTAVCTAPLLRRYGYR